MSRYVEFTLADGSTLFVESDEPGPGVVQATRGLENAPERAAATFEQAAENARKAAVVILDQVRSAGDRAPSEIEITFGLKASGELQTLVVASSGAAASFGVKLTWRSAEPRSKVIPVV